MLGCRFFFAAFFESKESDKIALLVLYGVFCMTFFMT